MACQPDDQYVRKRLQGHPRPQLEPRAAKEGGGGRGGARGGKEGGRGGGGGREKAFQPKHTTLTRQPLLRLSRLDPRRNNPRRPRLLGRAAGVSALAHCHRRTVHCGRAPRQRDARAYGHRAAERAPAATTDDDAATTGEGTAGGESSVGSAGVALGRPWTGRAAATWGERPRGRAWVAHGASLLGADAVDVLHDVW